MVEKSPDSGRDGVGLNSGRSGLSAKFGIGRALTSAGRAGIFPVASAVKPTHRFSMSDKTRRKSAGPVFPAYRVNTASVQETVAIKNYLRVTAPVVYPFSHIHTSA